MKRSRAIAALSCAVILLPFGATGTARAVEPEPPVEVAAAPPEEEPPTCEEQKADLVAAAAADPTKLYATCAEPTTLADPLSAPDRPADEVSASILSIPAWCRAHHTDPSITDMHYLNRTESCWRDTYNVVNVWEAPSGALIGQLTYKTFVYSVLSPTSGTWNQVTRVQVDRSPLTWGAGASPTWRLRMVPRCGMTADIDIPEASGKRPCTATIDITTPQTLATDMIAHSTYTSPVNVAGARFDHLPVVKMTFTEEQTTPGVTDWWSWPGRCDKDLPGNTSSVGCVYHSHWPTLNYAPNGPYPQLASHIRAAQNSGLPSSLRRLYDSTKQTANRDRACPSSTNAPWLPRPIGPDGVSLTCDEYPFASTWQGASTTSNPGPGRTHFLCGINTPRIPLWTGGTDPNGYSICMINEAQNRLGGGEVSKLFREKRVLHNDWFNVTTK